MLYLLLFLLTAYAANSGFKDAILFSRAGADAFSWNEHIVFMLERLLLVAVTITGTQINTIQALGCILSFALTFSFAHNQSYYYGRSLIDKTPFVWKYSSTTSTAKIELNYTQRFTLFLLGVGFIVLVDACTN